mmetsp:Transcript_17317/g.21308  ORF Transcript_17317/g.21308 Transcript_17317/m.21308 type:complete len:153 (+) Transcript_17317:540-998(+)
MEALYYVVKEDATAHSTFIASNYHLQMFLRIRHGFVAIARREFKYALGVISMVMIQMPISAPDQLARHPGFTKLRRKGKCFNVLITIVEDFITWIVLQKIASQFLKEMENSYALYMLVLNVAGSKKCRFSAFAVLMRITAIAWIEKGPCDCI